MEIRLGTPQEMEQVWGEQFPQSTKRFFLQALRQGQAEFWTIEEDSRLIGELYLFFSLEDPDFAVPGHRAYLCAFRVIPEKQGRGYGTQLMQRVLKRARELGYREASIGVEETSPQNLRMYRRMGFTRQVKVCTQDPCDVNEQFHPVPCEPFMLLLKSLET